MRLAVVALLCVACGPGSYTDYRSQAIDATCDWAKKCGLVGSGDRAACPIEPVLAITHDSAADRAAAGALDTAASVSSGRMSYDSDRAGDCVHAIRTAPCDPILAARSRALACNAVVRSNVATGATCWGDTECTGGECIAVRGCSGSCFAYASPGDACSDDAGTLVASTCDPTVELCEDATCQLKVPEGQTCVTDRSCLFDWVCIGNVCVDPLELDDGDACDGSVPCHTSSACDPSTKVCTKQGARGEACASANGCQDGLACAGLSTGSGTCSDWLDVGEPCTDGSACPASQTCTNGACTSTVTTAGVGEDCSARACAAGLSCGADKTCDFTRALFGDCGSVACEPDLSCSGGDGGLGGGICLPSDPASCFAPPT